MSSQMNQPDFLSKLCQGGYGSTLRRTTGRRGARSREGIGWRMETSLACTADRKDNVALLVSPVQPRGGEFIRTYASTAQLTKAIASETATKIATVAMATTQVGHPSVFFFDGSLGDS